MAEVTAQQKPTRSGLFGIDSARLPYAPDPGGRGIGGSFSSQGGEIDDARVLLARAVPGGVRVDRPFSGFALQFRSHDGSGRGGVEDRPRGLPRFARRFTRVVFHAPRAVRQPDQLRLAIAGFGLIGLGRP
ncbi:hypothetical protein [Nocardia brasiliensis]|uniref:hypothetical protein n=1 Tax=Nocardia brasiliensis TaxID=37326 RepID=UPI00189328F7|nr:hypothetical protein [Nocardia brasiliensis]MBF6543588.1 hypothetical protein [Nocardia brasiliensis]